MTPRGAAVGTFKHGRHSKYLPHNLRELYEQALGDEDLLSNREQVALLTARVVQLVERLQTGETREIWAELRRAWEQLLEARGAADPNAMQECLNRIGLLIRRGGEAEQTWELLSDAINERVKASEAEQRYLASQRQMMSVEQVMTMFAYIVESVRRHVVDSRALQAISSDLTTLMVSRGFNDAIAQQPDEPDPGEGDEPPGAGAADDAGTPDAADGNADR